MNSALSNLMRRSCRTQMKGKWMIPIAGNRSYTYSSNDLGNKHRAISGVILSGMFYENYVRNIRYLLATLLPIILDTVPLISLSVLPLNTAYYKDDLRFLIR